MEALYKLESAAMQNGAFSHSLDIRSPDSLRPYLMRCAVYAISYYITTGRAYSNWESAFAKANPEKLLAYVVSRGSGSDTEYIHRVTAYLRRYCGLRQQED